MKHPIKNLLAAALALACALCINRPRPNPIRPLTARSPSRTTTRWPPPAAVARRVTTRRQEAELAKKLQNPVASLISVPIQNNWDFGIGPAHAMQYTANIQPVIPISISDDWNLIIRTIVPVIYQEAIGQQSGCAPASVREKPFRPGRHHAKFFLFAKGPGGRLDSGRGAGWLLSHGDRQPLGAGQWGAGPTIVALQQKHGFTYGILANHIWSFTGQQGRGEINATFLQPFVSYTTKTYTTFSINTETTYNWATEESTAPMNFMVQQLVKIGKQPIAFQLGYRYYVEKPDGGPDWGLRFAITFLFPKG